MADLPVENGKKQEPKEQEIKVTNENAPVLMVHFLSKIYGRLGYIVKLLEEKK